MEKFILRIFRALMYRSKFADRISALEMRAQLLEIWNFDLNLMKINYEKFLKRLQLHKVNEIPLLRIGSKYDGGYVLANSFEGIKFVVSLGVGSNVESEIYFADLNKKIFLFDGTIKKLPRKHENFQYERVNVYGINPGPNSSVQWKSFNKVLNDIFEDIKSAYQESVSNTKADAVLMIDIEGSEYDVLLDLKREYLSRFQQVTIEFHNLHRELRENQNRLERCLSKLNHSHMLIAAHGNNFGGYLSLDGQDYPDVLELSWLKKGIGTFAKVPNSLLGISSNPNNPRNRELQLEWR
jgi:hypothetical protein